MKKKFLKWGVSLFLTLCLAAIALGSGLVYAKNASAATTQAATSVSALRSEALSLQGELAREATSWSNKHTYYDRYNKTTYHYGYEYIDIAYYPTDNLLAAARTSADYEYIIGQLQGWMSDFSAYTKNFSSTTASNRVHATDLQLLESNHEMTGKVIVISLSEQALRVYDNGKLVNAFQVVTGMPGHPSLPGSWWVEGKYTNITFLSGLKPGQAGYYPPTLVAWALQYHSAGYFIHQSWWRSLYGRNMEFPHADPGGTAFATEGSHGCINVSTPNIKWLYNYVSTNSTKIIIY